MDNQAGLKLVQGAVFRTWREGRGVGKPLRLCALIKGFIKLSIPPPPKLLAT